MNCRHVFKKIFLCLIALLFVFCLLTAAGAAEKPRYYRDPAADKTGKIPVLKTFVDPLKIGLILPLTGKGATAGNRALDAVLLGSGVFDRGGHTPFTLIMEDSQNSRETAVKAVSKLADEDGVICIISLSEDVVDEAAVKEAQRLKIPILTVTSQKDITAVGDYVFRNFPTHNRQITALVRYAVEDVGSTRFAVFYPDNPYGRDMKDLFREEVLRCGGRIVKTQSYDATKADFNAALDAMISDEKTPGVSQGEPPKRRVSFDALFIPDSYIHARSIAHQLARQKVQGVQLLGTSAWHHPDLLKAGGSNLEGAVLVDGFFPNSFFSEVNDFTDAYYAAFGREPDLPDAVAFDAIKIITEVLGSRRIDTRDAFRKELLKVKDYPGVTGRTSFFQQRDAAKEAFVLKVSRGQIIQVK